MQSTSKRLFRWQLVVLCLMVVGYSGYYLCRSNLSVLMPLIIDDLVAHGVNPDLAKVRMGLVASLGILGYAICKFCAGGLADLLGGRRGFLVGMGGIVICTALFAVGGGMPIFTIAWLGNRCFQSMGWAGMVKISARWFAYTAYGRVMAILSLAYLFGDAASRAFMGYLLSLGFGWRAIFFVTAGIMGFLFACSYILIKDSPQHIGEEEPPEDVSLMDSSGGDVNVRSFLKTLLRNNAFRLVCVLSFGLTLVRETFNTWTPTYFVELVGFTHQQAATHSAWFPFFGGISVLIAGYLGDKFGRSGRALLILCALVAATFALFSLSYVDAGSAKMTSIMLISAVGLLLIGPYSFLAGALALDFGGKRAGATAAGIIDGVGYLGGYLAGQVMAKISVLFGWQGAFVTLACVAALSSVVAALFAADQSKVFALATTTRAGRTSLS